MKRLFHLLPCLIFCFLPLTATALSIADITRALDLPGNVTVTGFTQAGSDAKWETIKGSSLKKYVTSGTIPIKDTYVLQAKTCKKKDPQKTAYITMRVQGAGTLHFNYQTSLDVDNDSRIYAYLDGDSSFPEWEESGWFAKDEYMTGDWFWYEGEIYLDGESYTRTLTLAIDCPDGDSDYYEKPDLWDDDVLDYVAWLDNFTWEEDTWTDFLVFSPDPETDGIFSDTCDVDIISSYGNLSFYYTLDGSTPTKQSNLYNPDQGITINQTTTIKAQAYDGSDPIGKIHEATYTARLPEPTIVYKDDKIGSAKIELTSTVSGVTFYYTIDGTSPTYDSNGTPTGTTKTGNSLTLDKTTTVTAISHKSGQPDSEEMTETVSVTTPAPTITIADEDFTGSVTATITGNGTCQYIVSYPSGQKTTATGKSVTVTRTCTLTATAQAEGQEISAATTRRIFLPPTLTVLCDSQPSTTNVFETSAKVTATATDGTAQFSQDKTTWATFPAAGKTTNVPVTWYFRTIPADYNADADYCCRLPLVLQKTAPVDMTAFKDSLQYGWNLVSFPGQLSANSISALLQAANFFALDNHVLHLATDIAPGKAYFLFKQSGLSLPDQLQAVVVSQPSIASGYSLVAPTDQAPLVLPDLWKWDSIGKKYLTTTSVPVFSGAWHLQK